MVYFSDIGKKASGLLTDNKVYSTDVKVDVSYAPSSSLTFAASETLSQDQNLSANVSAKYNSGAINLGGKIDNSGKITADGSYKGLVKGLKLSSELTSGKSQSVTTSMVYDCSGAGIKGKMGVMGNSNIEGSLGFGLGSAIDAGAELKYNRSNGSLSALSLASQYKTDSTVLSLKLATVSQDSNISFVHQVNDKCFVATDAAVNYGSMNTKITVGAQYKVDSGATLKTRLDSDGQISGSWSQNLQPGYTVNVNGTVNARNLKSQKVGVGIALADK